MKYASIGTKKHQLFSRPLVAGRGITWGPAKKITWGPAHKVGSLRDPQKRSLSHPQPLIQGRGWWYKGGGGWGGLVQGRGGWDGAGTGGVGGLVGGGGWGAGTRERAGGWGGGGGWEGVGGEGGGCYKAPQGKGWVAWMTAAARGGG